MDPTSSAREYEERAALGAMHCGYGVARRNRLQVADCLDVGQDAALGAIKAVRRPDHDASRLRGLIGSIGYRQVEKQKVRNAKTWRHFGGDPELLSQVADPSCLEAEEVAASAELLDAVLEAIGALPERQRQAFEFLMEGCSRYEIATLMTITPHQVRTAIETGRCKIRVFLESRGVV